MYTGRLLGWTIRGPITGRGKNVLPSPKRPDGLWGLPTPFAMGTGDFPGQGFQKVGKRPESETDHSTQCGMNAANVLPLQQAPSLPAPGNIMFTVTRTFCVCRRAELDGKIWALKHVLASLQQQ